MGIYELSARDIDGTTHELSEYRGKALLIVNVASECGLTPHYAGIQKLFDKHADRGLVVLGFPCNQFGAQEPGSESAIKELCSTRYRVTFPMFAKVEVNGAGRHPLFAWLTAQASAPDSAGDIKWNFAKFVVDRKGQLVARFAPPTDPADPALAQAIETALAG